MKILVLSDSHSSLRFMRDCVDAVKPDVIVHLGDHYDDAAVLREEYPETEGRLFPALPDEKARRVGQSVAAASLPEIVK